MKKAGVIFCSISEALREHPELVRKYLGSVVPQSDNYYAALNSAVFSDGSFVYVPEGVRCPMELSTYFRINEKNTGQFERTLIIAEKGAYVSYLEGCTAPMRDEHQLHAAVVELIALDDAEIKYSTVQNWYPGDKDGKGGIYNFVTKRGDCRGRNSKISWTQVETGSAITWKYPSCILRGDGSRGEFYSIAISNGRQQVDSGTKMIHLGKNTSSRIISKGIAAGPLAEHLSRPRLGASPGDGRAQLHQLRQPADRQRLRRPHRALHRSQECERSLRARGDDVQDLRRQAVLLHAARAVGGGGGGADRQRLRARRAAAAADGVHGRDAEADRHQPRRERGVSTMSEPWFKPKTFGYGATPANWKGWAAIGAYAVVMTVLAMVMVVEPTRGGAPLPKEQLVTYLATAGLLTVGFLVLCRIKTDGVWSWRWGNSQGDKH